MNGDPSFSASTSDTGKRKRLLSRAERLDHIFLTLSEIVVLIEREEDGRYRCVEANEAITRIDGLPVDAIIGKRVDEIIPPDLYVRRKALFDQVIETRLPVELEHEVRTPDGMRTRFTRFHPILDEDGGCTLILSIGRDITESKRAEREREAHVRYLESMNRVAAVLEEDLDVEIVLQRAVEALLDIFKADRAFMAYPADPGTPVLNLSFLAQVPDVPQMSRSGSISPSPQLREVISEVLSADGPVVFGSSHPTVAHDAYGEKIGLRSRMIMAIRPKLGPSWIIGFHQCSHDRVWSPEEMKLFRDIVARIKGALENLMLHRDLKKTQEFYHLMTEVMPQMVWTTDSHGAVNFVNRRWMEFTGQDWERSLGSGGIEALHPDDVERCLQRWIQSMRTGEPYEIELRYRRGADGAYVWHLVRAYPIRDAQGQVAQWIGTCTDISDAKQIQETSASSREEMNVILQGVDEGISAQDRDGKLIYANRKFAEFSGFASPEELLAAPIAGRMNRYEMYDEEGRPITWERLPGRRALEGEAHPQLIMRLHDRANGSERWLNTKSSGVPGPDGRIVMAINFAQDITSMRKANEEAAESRERLSAILGRIADSIIVQEPTGKVLYANEAAARLFDLPSQEVLMEMANRPGRLESEQAALAFMDEKGNPYPTENLPSRLAMQGIEIPPVILRFRQGSKGKEKWVLAQAKPIFDPDGKVLHSISMAQDITEVREKGEAVRMLQKMESLGKLAGGIAHDFNNLLVTINGYSEMGLSQAQGQPVEDYFQEILKSGRRAAALTQQLLAYSRRQMVVAKPFLINDVVADMEKLLRRLIGEDINLKTELRQGLPFINADPSQIEQVIMNLVVNARDAMADGGDLILETGTAVLDARQLAASPEAKPGEFVFLSVSDTGVGMSAEVMDKAFEPFFTTKPIGKGTGLGLASVYGIVKQGGGHITVESAPGQGAVFKIFLPVAEGEAAAHESASGRAASTRPITETILLVEDEDSVRNFILRILRDQGYAVTAAKHGLEALELAKKMPAPLHLLLTDVVMPFMRGTELVERVGGIHPETEVLLMSGYLDDSILTAAASDSKTNFLQKPFRIEDLTAKVRSILDRTGSLRGSKLLRT